VEFAAVIRRTVGLLAEIALSAGFLHDGRSCEVGIAALCKSAVPFWHAQDFHPVQAVLQGQSQLLLPQQVGGDDSGNGALRWRHVQASVRLFQTVHLLADVISDWDTVVDAFDQLVSYVDKTLSLVQCRSSPLMTAPAQLRQSHVDDDISIGEVEKMVDSIERFKVYTASISDESLVRLMTSLVTFSLNNLASGGSGSVSSSGPTGRSLYACCSTRDPNLGVIIPPYLVDGVNSGTVSFCLQAVIEIAKINSKRAPCIWQMVTSHLRMLASLKVTNECWFFVPSLSILYTTIYVPDFCLLPYRSNRPTHPCLCIYLQTYPLLFMLSLFCSNKWSYLSILLFKTTC
jgi:hypothetical protein